MLLCRSDSHCSYYIILLQVYYIRHALLLMVSKIISTAPWFRHEYVITVCMNTNYNIILCTIILTLCYTYLCFPNFIRAFLCICILLVFHRKSYYSRCQYTINVVSTRRRDGFNLFFKRIIKRNYLLKRFLLPQTYHAVYDT